MRRLLLYLVLGIWLFLTTKFTYDVNQGDPAFVVSWKLALLTSLLAFNLPIWMIIWFRGLIKKRRKRIEESSFVKSKLNWLPKLIRFTATISILIWIVNVSIEEGNKQVAMLANNPITVESKTPEKTKQTAVGQEKYVAGEKDAFLSWITVGKKSKNPVVWKTCKEIPVYVNPGDNQYAEDDVKFVIDYVNDISGLKFVFAGTNKEPLVGSLKSKVGRVQITYDNRENFVKGFRDNHAIGIAGSTHLEGEIISGQIALYVPAMNEADETLRRNVILHEFGHLLGLGHTTTSGDIMYPETNGVEITNYNQKIIDYFVANPGCDSAN